LALDSVVTAADQSPAKLARQWIDSGVPAHTRWAGHDVAAIAWALKDECYAAWNSQPQRAVLAAQRLHDLCRLGPGPAAEIQALADWTAGIAAVTGGHLVDAVQAFDRAHDAFRLLGQAKHAAATQVPRIMALSMLGRYDDAITCAEHTQREFIALHDPRAAAKVSLNLGGLHLLRGGYAQGVRHSRDAAVLFARVGDHEHSVMADINMAGALSWLGDFDEALRIYARAEMRATAHAFPVLQALVEEAVALVRFARGQFGQALAGFERARRRYEQLAMPRQQAVVEKQLADTYLELNLLPEALALFEVTLARFRTLNLHTEEPWTLAQRGRAQSLLGQHAEAAQSFVQAGELFATQGNVVGQAAVSIARAELALAAGESGAALELAAQAARGFGSAGQLEGRLRADVVRAHALLRAASVEQAQALFEAALAQAHAARLLPLQVRCLTGQGLAAQSRGQTQAAHDAFSKAVTLFEQQRRALPDDAMRSAFLSDHLRPYQELLRLALDAHAQQPSPQHAAEVLRLLDRFRASALGERVASLGGADAGSVDSVATERLRTRLNWLHRKVQRQREEGAPAAHLVEEMRSTEHALLEQARRERLSMPAQSPSGGDNGFDPAELQRQLGPADALVEYGVQDDELFACVVNHTGIAVHRRIAPWSAVLEALRSARFQIETLRHGAMPVEEHLAHLTERARLRLRRLHDLVWQPLVPALGVRQRVLVVPHAQLGALPFAALDDGHGCLAERHELAIAPSARLALHGLLRQPAPAARALVLGESARLAHAAEEARAVADLFGSDAAVAFIGKAASIETLRQHAAGFDVIHLACHAQFRSDNPTFSALHLHDGALTVDLIETLGLAPATVVLGGCETGLAEIGSGDEMVGLVRAFMIAGAARVLASMWPVDDAVTAGFMASFYSALRRGEAPATALCEAQMAVRRKHPHPLYWAAFTLYGGW
jgi:CHAT domain-containing protein